MSPTLQATILLQNNNNNLLNLYSAFLDTQRRLTVKGGTSLTTTSENDNIKNCNNWLLGRPKNFWSQRTKTTVLTSVMVDFRLKHFYGSPTCSQGAKTLVRTPLWNQVNKINGLVFLTIHSGSKLLGIMSV